MKLPPSLKYSFWDLENIKIQYYSKHWVQVSCKYFAKNYEEIEIKNIHYTLIDRLFRVNFDEKVKRETLNFIVKLKERNKKIEELYLKSQMLKEKISDYQGYGR